MLESKNKFISEAENNTVGETVEVSNASEMMENFIHENENSEYDSDYYDDDNNLEAQYLQDCAGSIKLPKKGHELKHGRLIANQGSKQQKLMSTRRKALVKYGKCDFHCSTNDIDDESQVLVNDMVKKSYYFNEISHAIASGERSVILHCPGIYQLDYEPKPQEFIIKVYRLQFGMDKIEKWTYNEKLNSRLMYQYLNVPGVFYPTKNIICMKFIGDDGKPAPNLNLVTFEITENLYTDVITRMYKLYNEGKRVHGKLSAKTIVWWREQLYFISLSRGVEADHPNALQLLMKDCCHITHFFKSKGLLRVKSIMNLFKFITGLSGLEQPDASVLLVLKYTRRPVKNRQKKKKLPHETI